MDIVDAFVVTLGLDPSQYNREIKKYRDDRKKLQEEQTKGNKDQEQQQKRLVDGMRSLRNETAGFLFMIAGANGLKDFAQNIISGDAATGRLAANLGVATEQLSAWEGAVRKVGGSKGSIDAAFSSLVKLRENYKLGIYNPDQLSTLQRFGISNLQDPQEMLLKIAGMSQRMSRPQFAQLAGILGFNADTINLLTQGREGVAKLLAEQRKLGVVTQDDTEAAQHFQSALADIKTTIEASARPWMEKLADVMANVAQNQDALNAVGSVAIGVMGALAIGAAAAAPEITAVAAAISAVVFALEELKKAKAGDGSILGTVKQGYYNILGGWYRLKADTAWQNAAHTTGKDHAYWVATAKRYENLYSQNREENRTSHEGTPAPSPLLKGGGAGGVLAEIRAKESGGLGGYNAQAYNTRGGGNAVGLSNINLTGMTLGDVFSYQTGEMRAHTRGHRGPGDVGSTGVGAYQFESQTLATVAARVFGPNWRKVAFSPGNQDKMASYLYNSIRNNPAALRNTWALFSDPRQYARGAAPAGGAVNGGNVSIGQITIYTAATDAKGIAHDLRGELSKQAIVVQANRGLHP